VRGCLPARYAHSHCPSGLINGRIQAMKTQIAALKLFNSIASMNSVNSMIDEGAVEDRILECKTIQGNNVNPGVKAHFSECVSAFSNTAGGVIMYGLETTKITQTNEDKLVQVQFIGNIAKAKKEIELAAVTMLTPAVVIDVRIIRKKKADTKGVLIVYIPKSQGDPIRANNDHYYLRSGDSNYKMDHETLKRMFASVASPELEPEISPDLSTRKEGVWNIPVAISNLSTFSGKDVKVCVEVKNPDNFESISSADLPDQSKINLGRKVFIANLSQVVHKGMNTSVGELALKPKVGKRKALLEVFIYATNMEQKAFEASILLVGSRPKISIKEL